MVTTHVSFPIHLCITQFPNQIHYLCTKLVLLTMHKVQVYLLNDIVGCRSMTSSLLECATCSQRGSKAREFNSGNG
ncbi:hypothetical protein HanXRQr2_Chr09g0393181 [Helianthus annuus]|uniref:Uncharacterized protein n=1 Tax=Helianthus annuus TaxID=4232 RepID=A0A9K3I881_HELAN|nr:hypothetical protein HanXRQr2_Chr09g0393181 [Helianthus annuus]KAJ0534828.1 hypothetical protein HanIR_Chr09g0424031 [Helianthus annuus]